MTWSRVAGLWRPAAVVLPVLLVLGLGGWWLAGTGGSPREAAALPGTTSAPTLTGGVPTVPTTPAPGRSTAPTRSCATSARFAPTRVVVPGVTAGAGVVAPPRDAQGVPGVPPLTRSGKEQFAFDRAQGIAPGDPAGHVLLNAHTWPDGSAIGNRMLARLEVGDPIVVEGASTRLCYRVTERIEVLAAKGLARYYDRTGPPRLAIVVCSGDRIGPGDWTKRTIWFATPSA